MFYKITQLKTCLFTHFFLFFSHIKKEMYTYINKNMCSIREMEQLIKQKQTSGTFISFWHNADTF